jgi:succinate dehydrogenase/fumarate reductase flavoprotein subunit
MYTTALDLRSMIDVSRMVVASSQAREETRGAHFRMDFPQQNDEAGFYNNRLRRGDNGFPEIAKTPVRFTHKSPPSMSAGAAAPVVAAQVSADDE